jgi:HEAT repeat protein
MAEPAQTIGIFTTDAELVVRTWDPWLARVTGIAVDEAQAQRLATLVPDLEARGLLQRFRQVLADGVVVVLAPAFHRYLIPCAPQTPARHFETMQQHVTIAPLRDHDQIVGAIVTLRDVTARRERERDLADDLASPDELARLRAAQALADEPEAPADMLLGTLGDASWRVRKAAVSGLAQRAESEVVGQLVRALHDAHRNPSVLNSALQALALRQGDAVAPLIELLQTADADLRSYVVLALGEQTDPRARQALLRALDDLDTNVRYHAIEALGKLKAAEAVERLVALVDSGDFFLAFPALDALARIADPQAAPRIVPLLADPLLGAPAADTLAKIGDLAAVAPLAAALGEPSAPAIAIGQALAAIHDRHTARHGAGAAVAELARGTISPLSARNLLDALATAQAEQLPALARVLGWLEGPPTDQALARLLAQPAARAEIVEALVDHGAPAIEPLIEQLDAEDLETRQAAAFALGRIGNPSAVPALMSRLADEPELARVAAAALAKIGDQRAFEPLLGVLGHPSAAVRQAAIGALNSLGHPELAARAGALLQAADAHLRESAVKIVGYFGYPDYVPMLLECCRDPDLRVRTVALEHLPFVEHPAIVHALTSSLHDEIPAVRIAAARAFGYVEDQQAVPLLIGALGDQDAWVRYFAARSLGHQRAGEAAGTLAQLAQTDTAQQVRLAALEALGRIGGQRALAALIPFAALDDAELARAAIAALGQIDQPAAQSALLGLLDAHDRPLRLAAVEALGQHHGAAAVGPLLQLVAGAGPLAQAAVAALARMATPEAIGALIELLAEPARRATIVAALAGVGEGQAELVGRGLEHRQVAVRRSVVEALERMPHARGLEHIVAALDDPEPAVRLAAAGALGHRRSQAGQRLLAALAQSDPDAAVRQAAAEAIRS